MRRSDDWRITNAALLAIAIARRRISEVNARHALEGRSLVPRQGLQGEVGPAGRDGVNGKDGMPGRNGRDGMDGVDGLPGAPGPKGLAGDPGEAGPGGVLGDAPAFEWEGDRLRVENPDGTWDKFVDLQGPRGKQGARGAGPHVAETGSGMFDPDKLPAATSSELPTEFLFMQDGVWVRAPFSRLIGWMDAAPQSGGIVSGDERVKVNGSTVFVNGGPT
jgi:hypothetical protein